MRKATGRQLARQFGIIKFFASGSKRGRKPGYRKPKVLKKTFEDFGFFISRLIKGLIKNLRNKKQEVKRCCRKKDKARWNTSLS